MESSDRARSSARAENGSLHNAAVHHLRLSGPSRLGGTVTPRERKQILERLAGRVVEKIERKKVGGRTVEKVKEEIVGGILHWGREDGSDLDWFRQEIRKAYGGRAPKVLDPFAGGGAIPLEAMRLGCEATAMDINPVAWFILKCTLDYPQKFAG